MARNIGKPKELTGRHVLLMLIAFFGVTIGVNAVFITKAVSSFSGEDVKGSYRQGLEYNKTIERRQTQAALGWQVKTNLINASNGDQRFVIRLIDENGNALKGLSIDGIFKRPTDLALDKKVTFIERGDGIYHTTLSLPKGQWVLKAVASSAGRAFRFEDQIVIS